MAHLDHDLEHPKKRRRREIAPRPIVSRLLFDDNVKGDAAVVPEALWTRLALPKGLKFSTPTCSPTVRCAPD